jgi:hypothetical protein
MRAAAARLAPCATLSQLLLCYTRRVCLATLLLVLLHAARVPAVCSAVCGALATLLFALLCAARELAQACDRSSGAPGTFQVMMKFRAATGLLDTPALADFLTGDHEFAVPAAFSCPDQVSAARCPLWRGPGSLYSAASPWAPTDLGVLFACARYRMWGCVSWSCEAVVRFAVQFPTECALICLPSALCVCVCACVRVGVCYLCSYVCVRCCPSSLPSQGSSARALSRGRRKRWTLVRASLSRYATHPLLRAMCVPCTLLWGHAHR